MAMVRDILNYLRKDKLPHSEPSGVRYVCMAYLADWYHSLHYGVKISDVNWHSGENGPFNPQILDMFLYNLFLVEGRRTSVFGFLNTILNPSFSHGVKLAEYEKASLDFVIRKTSNLDLNDLLTLVKSTYPVMEAGADANIDLVERSKEYKSMGYLLEVA